MAERPPRLLGIGAQPVDGELLHRAIEAEGAALDPLGLNETERAILGATELVMATRARRACVEDAIELLRDVWSKTR